MRGPELRLLDGELEVGMSGQTLLDEFCFMPYNYGRGGRVNCSRSTKDVLEHRAASNFVQHFRERRFHPGPLPGGKNDDVSFSH
jgi:hypothetical protein